MVTFYTKAEALDILIQGTPEESIARIQKEREDRKYYLITAYTPYAGEEMEVYFSCCGDQGLLEFCDGLRAECASEWIDQHLSYWADDGYESYEDAEEDYYAGCGTYITVVEKEEYARASDAMWVMRMEE